MEVLDQYQIAGRVDDGEQHSLAVWRDGQARRLVCVEAADRPGLPRRHIRRAQFQHVPTRRVGSNDVEAFVAERQVRAGKSHTVDEGLFPSAGERPRVQRGSPAAEALPLNIDAYMGGQYNVDGTGPAPMTTVAFVAPGFFEVMGTPVIAGREFTFLDVETTERIAVVNEPFARAHGEPRP